MKKKIKLGLIIMFVIIASGVMTYAFNFNQVVQSAFNFETKAIQNASAGRLEFITGLCYSGQAVGTIIAISVGIILAIQFMTQGAEGKAEMKQGLKAYIVGVALLYGAFGVWSSAVEILQSNNGAHSGTSGASYSPPASAITKEYDTVPFEETDIVAAKQHKYNKVEGTMAGGTLRASGINWQEAMSSDQKVFLQNIIDMQDDATIRDVLIWARDRIGFDYEREDDATKWHGSRTCGWSSGTNWDRYLTLPNSPSRQIRHTYTGQTSTSVLHCGFDCSSFVSRAYYAVTNLIEGSESRLHLYETVPQWPYCCTTFYSSGNRHYSEDVAYAMGANASPWSYYGSINLTQYKDYLKPGDMLFSYDADHIMLFVGFNGDTPYIIHAGGNAVGVCFAAKTSPVGGVLRPKTNGEKVSKGSGTGGTGDGTSSRPTI